MKGLRLLAALALASLAIGFVYRFCYLRYVCDIEENLLQDSTFDAFSRSEQASARLTARANLETVSRCARLFPTVVNLHMIRAANLRILSRNGEAVSEYREALRYDRRPETFLELSLTQIDQAQGPAAVENLTTLAVLFIGMVADAPDPYRSTVYQRINPTLDLIRQQKATPALLRSLFDRVARPPV